MRCNLGSHDQRQLMLLGGNVSAHDPGQGIAIRDSPGLITQLGSLLGELRGMRSSLEKGKVCLAV